MVVDEVLAGAGAKFAYLFGSRAEGNHRPDSDADVAVWFGRAVGYLEQAAVGDQLRLVLHVPDVDLIALDDASLELRGAVVQRGRLLWSADEPARVAFEVRTRLEYLDYRPTLTEQTWRYLRQAAEGRLA